MKLFSSATIFKIFSITIKILTRWRLQNEEGNVFFQNQKYKNTEIQITKENSSSH